MAEHTPKKAAGPWRRWTFRIWIGLTIALVVYLAATIALVDDPRATQFLMGIPVPITMIVLLILGLGWLAWLVTARRRRP